MSHYSTHVGDLYDSYLDDYSEKACWETIKEYFGHFNIDEAQNELWKFAAGILSNDDAEDILAGTRRWEIIHFYEFTKLLIEVVGDLYHDFHFKKEKQDDQNETQEN
jgi:hypothetical protein